MPQGLRVFSPWNTDIFNRWLSSSLWKIKKQDIVHGKFCMDRSGRKNTCTQQMYEIHPTSCCILSSSLISRRSLREMRALKPLLEMEQIQNCKGNTAFTWGRAYLISPSPKHMHSLKVRTYKKHHLPGQDAEN